MTNVRQIVAGPSREELFDALRLRHEGKKVAFTVEPGPTPQTSPRFRVGNLAFNVQVDSIGVEDGSGNNWLLKLYTEHGVFGSQHLEGYFSTTHRRGWVRPTSR